ncbi:MAG: translation elongation factor Ts [Chthonomonadales bacterium]
MQITAQLVSQLREQTGAGMMECKKALVEAEGDLERARDILRTRGKAGAEKRAGRAAADGVVAAASTDAAAALLELNSETDFVARNAEFQALARDLAQLAAQEDASSVDELLERSLNGAPARHRLDDVLARLRENIVVRRFARYPRRPGAVLATYIHTVTNKIGVLLELEADAQDARLPELARNIAMHIAASQPQYVSREEVPEEAVEAERAVLTELTRNEGKPEAAIPKIVEGRLAKFYERVCLVDQPYVRDPAKKVGQLLREHGATARRFVLFVVGQG